MTAKKMTQTLVQDQPAHQSGTVGLHPASLLARSPIIGLILFLFGGLVFGGLVLNLQANGPLLAWDKAIATTLPGIALKGPAFLQPLMDGGYYLGDQVIAVLSILIGLYLLFKRLWKEFAMLAIGLVGASSLFLFLSNSIGRPRPPSQIWIVLTIPGIPSGHAITVVVFYGLLAYLLVPKIRSVVGKVAVIAAALFLIAFVGFSRIFTGGHYLTDILAGYAVGLAWSAFAYTLIELVFLKIRSRNVKKE